MIESLRREGPDAAHVREIGRWLARSAPDRSAVKFGLALLGVVPPPDIETMLTLGAHDDFTLYAVVGLKNSGAGERELFELARRVHGWGRIEVVERLADTTDSDVREWLLREGYQNSIIYEYLAPICARAGDLASRLAPDDVDDDLVASAGEMLEAIAAGNPGPPFSEYPDLAIAIDHYLRHLDRRQCTLRERRFVSALRNLVSEPDDLDLDEIERSRLLSVADSFLARTHFRALVEPALRAPDPKTFWDAKLAAVDLGIDIYDAVVERIENSLDEHPLWFDLMAATTPDHIDASLDLGRRIVDIQSIATGPSPAIGLGPTFDAHVQVGWFLQGLADHPGNDWDFIAAGLESPSIQNRNGALRALQRWPRDSWPHEAPSSIELLLRAEVDAKVRTFAGDVLRGDVPLDEAWRRTVDLLHGRGPELVPIARRLASSGVGGKLRSDAGFSSLVLWNGPYDSAAYEQLHVLLGRDADGFNVTLAEGVGNSLEQSRGLDEPDAEALAMGLAARLLG